MNTKSLTLAFTIMAIPTMASADNAISFAKLGTLNKKSCAESIEILKPVVYVDDKTKIRVTPETFTTVCYSPFTKSVSLIETPESILETNRRAFKWLRFSVGVSNDDCQERLNNGEDKVVKVGNSNKVKKVIFISAGRGEKLEFSNERIVCMSFERPKDIGYSSE